MPAAESPEELPLLVLFEVPVADEPLPVIEAPSAAVPAVAVGIDVSVEVIVRVSTPVEPLVGVCVTTVVTTSTVRLVSDAEVLVGTGSVVVDDEDEVDVVDVDVVCDEVLVVVGSAGAVVVVEDDDVEEV